MKPDYMLDQPWVKEEEEARLHRARHYQLLLQSTRPLEMRRDEMKQPKTIEKWTMPIPQATDMLAQNGIETEMPAKGTSTIVVFPYNHEKLLRITYRSKSTVTVAIQLI